MLTTEQVQKQITDWCRGENIAVPEASFRAGTVVLSGSVPTLRHAHLLERELSQQREVVSVVTSALQVEPRRDDAELLAAAREILAGCGCPTVELDVFEGVVTLSGHEPNLTVFQLLEDRLSGVPGVLDIRSTVTLEPPVESFDRESQTAPAGA